jgi:D-alanyl-D-alanine carboxypeptidase (penicillin-binding protein 5/6)
LLLAGALSLPGFGPPHLSDGAYPPLRLGPDELQGIARLKDAPEVGAAAALLKDLDSGLMLYTKSERTPLPPASTAKVMTALVVMKRAAPEETVTVSPAAAATGGSRMGLSAGEKLSVRDLLYGLLIPSGNDAAVALAEHVAGNTDAFVELMNQEAQAMGLGDTRFANPHGLDAQGATTSATDLAVMTQQAMSFPLFSEIVATRSARVGGHDLMNTNELLGAYPGSDGVKTGTTDAAGECLVASVNRGGHRLLAVIMGSSDRYADVRALLDYGVSNWRWEPVGLASSAADWIYDAGQGYRLQADGARDLMLPAWQWPLVQQVREITATEQFTVALPVGEMWLRLGSDLLGSYPLRITQGP